MRIDNTSSIQRPVSSPAQADSSNERQLEVASATTIKPVLPVEVDRVQNDSEADAVSFMSEAMLSKAVERANKALASSDRVIERSIHEKTHMVMYVVRDTKTKEVIAEFPPKKIEDMIAKMWELAGLFVDEKA